MNNESGGSAGGSSNTGGIKTDQQLKIALRNEIRARVIERKANILYWQKIERQSKTNSREKLEALENITLNKGKLAADEVFVQVIDEDIKKGVN